MPEHDDIDVFKQSYKNTQKDLAALTVSNCGSQRCTPDYTWGPGIRDHYLIHYVISGCGTYTIGSQSFSVKAGQAFLIYPDTKISYQADHRQPWHYCWAAFTGLDAGLLIRQMPFTEKRPVTDMEDGAAVQQAFKKIWNVRGSDFEHMIMMTGALYSALALFLKPDDDRPGSSTDYFKQAIDYIQKYYFFYGTGVQEIADYVGINRSYLYTVFKDKSGISPKEYLTRFRVRQAKSLLKETALPISAVAASVGYEDNLYFSKVFRRVSGISPTEYRKADVSNVLV